MSLIVKNDLAKMDFNRMCSLLITAIDSIGGVILGKPQQIRLAMTCLIARGHLLIEDMPGVGKTTLVHTMAKVLGLQYRRIQFTSDLLPADILGASVFRRDLSQFEFQPGPIFSQLILADEVNRATPKTQSALLEAMEEHQVTIDGETRLLPEPFFVIATQNPSNQIGTFPLPESQLDRFLMRIGIGYPDPKAERELLLGVDRKSLLQGLKPDIGLNELSMLQQMVEHIHVSDALLTYIQNILSHTRISPFFLSGLSPRAGLSLKHAAQAWAMIEGRKHVLPEDVQAVMIPVVSHRLKDLDHMFFTEQSLKEKLLEAVAIP